MVTFSIALLCFSFVISNPLTRIIAGPTSALVVALTMLCLQTAWGSSTAWKVWLDGFLPSLVGALQYMRGRAEHLIPFVLGVVESLRNRLASSGQSGTGNVQSSTGPQGGVVV